MNEPKAKISGFGIGEAGKVAETTPLDEIEAARLQPMRPEKMVRCSCGHTVPASLVMNANLGTSCPDCYDDMS